MPSNLFVVVFPRRVQAHTVVVDKKERPSRRGWGVGGLRSPPSLLGRDGKINRGDDKGNGQDQSGGRENTSCGSPTSGSSSRDGSSRGNNQGSASASAARNEQKNQKTVRVQLSRPTEDMVPDPSAAKQRRLNKQVHRRKESNQASWHATSSNYSLVRTDSAMSVGGGMGGSAGGASEWASEVLREHKKRQPFIRIPSRSRDVGMGMGVANGNAGVGLGNGSRGSSSLEDIYGESERSSRASTCAAFTTLDSGVGGDGGTGDGTGAAATGGKHHRKSASASSLSSLRGLIDDINATAPAVAAEVEAPDGQDRRDSGAAEAAGGGANVVGEGVGSSGDAGGEGVGVGVGRTRELEVAAARLKRQQELQGAAEQNRSGKVLTNEAAPQPQPQPQPQPPPPTMESVASEVVIGASALPASQGLVERRGVERGSNASLEGEGLGRTGEEGEMKNAREWTAREAPGLVSTPGSKRRLVTEVIGDDDVDVSRPQEMDEGEKVDIEKLVRGILVEMRGDQLLIGEPTYHISASGKLMTCIFPCDVEDAHLVLTRLESVGVGSETGSINVLPMEIGRSDITRHRRESQEVDEDKARRARHNRATGGRYGDSSGVGSGDGEKDEEAARRANERFRALASQIRVTQVTEEIRQGTKCHFDYMALLVASSAISAMGLATDNVAVVVAAMLVSPIMGPVLAFTFGTNVRDWGLAKKGFLVESFSLLICIGVGFLVGMVGVNFIEEDMWPTHEMETRGNPWGLLTGICIAIPSGMAVALSILSKNVNSLVGVAISASLLPPAVNTGLCLAVALIGPSVTSISINVMEYVMIALISMSLTIVNILSIYVAGVWLFIFKEVAPIKSENSFWSQDMIHARKFQQKLGKSGEGGEAAHLLRKTLLEAANRGASSGDSGILSVNGHIERKGSFSSNTNTHHRYRHKDRRRRPTVFDLFPDMGDDSAESGGGETGNTPGGTLGGALRDSLKGERAGARESIKSETGRLLGLMTNFLQRGDDHKGGDTTVNPPAAGLNADD